MAAPGEEEEGDGRGVMALGFVRGSGELLFIHGAGAARCRAASEGGLGRVRAVFDSGAA
jgi:hypothetical protein